MISGTNITLIPITQSACRKGRSTTENVFTFKVLSEKTVTEENSEINIRMIDTLCQKL